MAAVSSVTSPLPRSARILLGTVLPLGLVALWAGASTLGIGDPRFLPPPSAVVARLVDEAAGGWLWGHVWASLGRDLAGFAIGSLLGLGMGCAFGLSPWFARLFGPTFNGAKQISLFAWIPLLSIWFGVGEAAKIAFIALAAFIPVVVNTAEGIRSVDPRLRELARVLCLPRGRVLWRVVLPGALPSIVTGIHLALIYGWLATVGAEYFMTLGPGIGGMMNEGREHFHMDVVILGVMLLGGIGALLNGLATLAEHRLSLWRQA